MANYLNETDKNSPGPCHKLFNNHYMKQKLLEKYGESVHMSNEEGSSGIVTIEETTAYILRKYHKQIDPLTEEFLGKKFVVYFSSFMHILDVLVLQKYQK